MENNNNLPQEIVPVYSDAIDVFFNMYSVTLDFKALGRERIIQLLGSIKMSPTTAKLLHKQLGDSLQQYEEFYCDGKELPVYNDKIRNKEREYNEKLKQKEENIKQSPECEEVKTFTSEETSLVVPDTNSEKQE